VKARLVLLALLLGACTAASPMPSPTLVPTLEPIPTLEPTLEPTSTLRPTPIPIPIDEAMLARRFTVLVAGSDSSRFRRSDGVDDWNTDALMVISVSPDQSRIAILSLPRDTVDVPMADGSIYRRKVNGMAQRLGMEALRGAMESLLGVQIDRYIRVDMDDFVWMVDAVGGIDVEVKTRLIDPKVDLHLEPGMTHMDGALALSFSRTRADSDYGRAARQQQVMLALFRKWLDPGLGALIGSVRLLVSLQTDIDIGDLPTLVEMGRRAVSAEANGTVLGPPRFSLFVGIDPSGYRGYVEIPDVVEIRAYARSLLAD
jgi:LCP family protein required for cell wall assembly